jgi:ABC-type sulfate transport system permease subunit
VVVALVLARDEFPGKRFVLCAGEPALAVSPSWSD